MGIIIRKGEKEDMQAVFELIKELAIYEKEPDAVIISLKDLEINGFGPSPLFQVKVAILDGLIVGMILYYYCFSTWKGKMLYIEDIVVSQKHRRLGIGKKLFDSVFKIAIEMDVQQIRFHVLDWNQLALGFYRKNYDVSIEDQWVTCKIDKYQF